MIKLWIADTEVNVISDWKTGSPIFIRGNLHWVDFENKGIIQQFEPEKIFQYNYWSTLSMLPDKPENYTVVRFELTSTGDKTILTLTLSDFPDETTYKHLKFYWDVTLEILKALCEQS